MNPALSARALYDDLKDKLRLDWVAGKAGGGRAIDQEARDEVLVGRLNCIHPSRIQVLGEPEISHLEQLGKNSRHDLVEQLFTTVPMAVFVTGEQPMPDDLRQRAEYSATPLFYAHCSAHILITELNKYLATTLSEKSVIHGVFMDVKGIGVLITGESGIGKSELALELLSRGHRLVADDAPEFARIGPDIINGRSTALLQDFIEVRGIGIMNVRSLFGDSAVKPDKNLRLIVHLKHLQDDDLLKMNRLDETRNIRLLLEVEIPEVIIPVAPGRNLAVLVESAVSNHILRTKGYNATQEFIKRQQLLMTGDQI